MSRGGRIIGAVAGGTGLLGSLVADALAKQGAQARILSRKADASRAHEAFVADLDSGAGLAEAMSGADAAIWCAHDRDADANDARWIRTFLSVCLQAGVKHFVYTGIAGIETAAASSYYAGKLREEAAICASDAPYTILRATQFHTLAVSLLEACDDGRVILAPRAMMLRPVAPEAVAERLAALALQPPQGRARDLAGPEDCSVAGLARQWTQATGLQRAIVETPEAPPRWAMLEKLTHGEAERAGPTFAQWLRARS